MARIVHWNPVREMAAMQSAMDRLMDDTWNNYNTFGSNLLSLDVHETEVGYIVVADLPGLDADQIDIRLHENTLTISGELLQQQQPEGVKTLITERNYGAFRRSINLPAAIDADAVEADYSNGVLTLTLPKSEAARPRQIAVRRAENN